MPPRYRTGTSPPTLLERSGAPPDCGRNCWRTVRQCFGLRRSWMLCAGRDDRHLRGRYHNNRNGNNNDDVLGGSRVESGA